MQRARLDEVRVDALAPRGGAPLGAWRQAHRPRAGAIAGFGRRLRQPHGGVAPGAGVAAGCAERPELGEHAQGLTRDLPDLLHLVELAALQGLQAAAAAEA